MKRRTSLLSLYLQIITFMMQVRWLQVDYGSAAQLAITICAMGRQVDSLAWRALQLFGERGRPLLTTGFSRKNTSSHVSSFNT
jgi:hypothetical protein